MVVGFYDRLIGCLKAKDSIYVDFFSEHEDHQKSLWKTLEDSRAEALAIAKMSTEPESMVRKFALGDRKLPDTFCELCRRQGNSQPLCSGCKTAHYCSQKCQKVDWSNHKQKCRLITAAKIENRGKQKF